MALDLTLSPLYRTNGQEAATMPGLLVTLPPRKAARGREHDRLVVYLLLTGNASFSSAEYSQFAADAADVFYRSPGSLTSALKATTESVNRSLLERNMSTSGRGQYVNGWLTLAVLRDQQCTLLMSGPMHVHHLGISGTRHIFEPAISGRGLGLSQTANVHFSQVTLQAGDNLLFCGKVPPAWETALGDAVPVSLSATRRRLLLLTGEDLNAVLVHPAEGTGNLTLLPGGAEPKDEPARQTVPPPSLTSRLPRTKKGEPAEEGTPQDGTEPLRAHFLQPSAYAIPPQHTEEIQPDSEQYAASPTLPPAQSAGDPSSRIFPPSIPRARPQEKLPEPPAEEKVPSPIEEDSKHPEAPREPSQRTRQAAKALAGSIRNMRLVNERVGQGLRKFLPRLLPGNETGDSPVVSTSMMMFIAILAPLIVVTIASVVYLRFGRSVQYETYMNEANEIRAQAQGLSDPVEQRKAWENVLLSVERAQSVRETTEAADLRREANAHLDQLLGFKRLVFMPAFSTKPGIEISRMAASEMDLFMLNASNGEVLHAQFASGRGFQMDENFHCEPGEYGGFIVGPIVDILAIPVPNSISATLLGIDANGNLLYCAPDQVAQAIPLLSPDTGWQRVTGFTWDKGVLYVLDATASAVWVYVGKDGTFIDTPYFFFGSQTPAKQDVIDLLVSDDTLYMLHADGHLSLSSDGGNGQATQYQDPVALTNPFPAYQDQDLFGTAHITQIAFSAPPDTSILLLSADDQSVLRITRSYQLLDQLRPSTDPSNRVASGPVGAMAVGPNHVLYLAINGQVYFATDMP